MNYYLLWIAIYLLTFPGIIDQRLKITYISTSTKKCNILYIAKSKLMYFSTIAMLGVLYECHGFVKISNQNVSYWILAPPRAIRLERTCLGYILVDLLLDWSTALDPVVFSRNISIVDVITKLLGLTSPSHNFSIRYREVLPRSITDYQQKYRQQKKAIAAGNNIFLCLSWTYGGTSPSYIKGIFPVMVLSQLLIHLLL